MKIKIDQDKKLPQSYIQIAITRDEANGLEVICPQTFFDGMNSGKSLAVAVIGLMMYFKKTEEEKRILAEKKKILVPGFEAVQ